MPEIQAFRGVRYDLGHVGALSDVVAPPYDVIGPQLQTDLYKKHPCNVIRLILNRIEPGDDDASDNRYTRAARFLKNWQSEGVLVSEGDPAVYVYDQEFTFACEGDGLTDVIGIEAAGDECRALVVHAVPDHAGAVVLRMARQQQLAGQAVAEFGDRRLLELDRSAVE